MASHPQINHLSGFNFLDRDNSRTIQDGTSPFRASANHNCSYLQRGSGRRARRGNDWCHLVADRNDVDRSSSYSMPKMRPSRSTPLLFVVLLVFLSRSDSFSNHECSVHRRQPATFLHRQGRLSPRYFGVHPTSPTRNLVVVKAVLDDDEEEDDDEEDDDDDDDDDDDPLAKGIDSVSWLPTVVGAKASTETLKGTREGAEIMPLFPLGGIVYTPNSEHVLNIFEPRYREMYNDILMNGSKKFVVSMSHPSAPGRFAAVGVVFEVADLKEVSEQTADRVKYICNHKVTGRVKIHRILNPEAWETRDTYLRVEGSVTDDSGKQTAPAASNDVYGAVAEAAEQNPKEEKALRGAFSDLVEIQHELEEDVRFTRASVATLAVKPGSGSDGLWQTIRLWQSFVDQRLMSRQNELQRDFQERLHDYLKKEKGLKDEEIPSAIDFTDLSQALQEEVKELQKRMRVELKPLVLESTLTMQKILEAKDHTARLRLLRHFIEAERKRLVSKKTLKGMFSGEATAAFDAAIPAEERDIDEDESDDEGGDDSDAAQSSIFLDEDDAFQ